MNANASARAVPVSGPQLDNRRVLAGLIDLAVVGVGAFVILSAAGVLGGSRSEVGMPLTAVILGWALYYYFACESSDSAQTLGKRVMGLRVERVDGGRLEMRDVALRTVLRVIDGLFAYLVGLIVMLATGERRGRLGDLAAGTRIVSAKAQAPAPAAAVAEPEAPRVPIAESGPAFAPVEDEEPVAEEPTEDEPAAEEPTEDEPVAEEPTEEEPAAEELTAEEPVAEADSEPSEGDTVDMASPSLKELAADVEATAGSAPDEPEEEPAEEPVAEEDPVAEEEPVAEEDLADDDLRDDDPLADADPEPEPDSEGDEEELAPAAEADAEAQDEPEAEDEPEADVKRIETVSAIDLVMEDSQNKS